MDAARREDEGGRLGGVNAEDGRNAEQVSNAVCDLFGRMLFLLVKLDFV